MEFIFVFELFPWASTECFQFVYAINLLIPERCVNEVKRNLQTHFTG